MAAARRRHDRSPTRSTILGSSGQCSRRAGSSTRPWCAAASCPPPSGEAPADPEAARAAIVEAYTTAANGSLTVAERQRTSRTAWPRGFHGGRFRRRRHTCPRGEASNEFSAFVRTAMRTRRSYWSTPVNAGNDRIGKSPARRPETALAVAHGNLWITPRLELRIRRLGVRVPPSPPSAPGTVTRRLWVPRPERSPS
jgi:hypothetical protein